MSKTAAVIGVTGLIGSQLYEQLNADGYFDHIRLLVRRPYKASDPRTEVKLVDFSDAESFRLALEGCETIFSAVGTTNKKVKGDQAAYRRIDYDIPVNAARFGQQGGCTHFVLVSSIGADPRSRTFYLRLKGEVEEAVRSTGVKSIHIMRPSLLLGNRQEYRSGEKLAKVIMSITKFVLPSRFQPVTAAIVGKAMIAVAKQDVEGFFIHEYRSIMRLAASL